MPPPEIESAPPGGPAGVRQLAITVWLATMLSGSWSLARFDVRFTAWGFLAEARYWLAMGLIALAGALLMSRPAGKAFTPRLSLWLGAVIAIHLYWLVSVAWAFDSRAAMPRIPEIVLLITVLLLTPIVFAETLDANLHFLMKLSVWVALVYLAGGVSGRWTEFGRMAAFGGGANVFARIVGTGLLAIAYLWSRTGRNAWLWAAPLLAYGAVMSGSRGGLLALALAGGVYIVHLGRHARLRARALWPVAVMTLALFVVRGPAIVSFWMTRFVELTLEQRYLTQRDQLFGAAVELFRGHAAFGAGLESYRATVGWVYPHNLILHIAAEQGAAGLTLLSVAALLFGWRLRRGALPSQRAALAVAGLYFAASMFSGGIYDARFVWLFTALYMIEPTARDSTPVLRG